MTTRMIILVAALTIAGCGSKQVAGDAAVADAGGGAQHLEAAPAAPPPPAQAAASPAATRTGAATIAYSYKLGFEVPARSLDTVVRAHRAACDALGPARCQLLNSSREGGDGDAAEASLDLRLAPAEVRGFEARIEASNSAAGGKLLSSNTTGEDITRQLIDADAALKAKRTLRDRLQTLLERHEGRLADLLAVEKALSETQQELDTAAAELAELQQRVSFSKLSIAYRSERPLGSTSRPLAEAVANAGSTISGSLALLLTAMLAIAPWIVPISALVWLVGWWRRRRVRRAPPA